MDYNNRENSQERNDYGHDREKQREVFFSKKIRAGRRTYFFDVKATRGNDYFVTITESQKDRDGRFVKSKVHLYKEDFNKFVEAMNETIKHVKSELMPDYNFDEFQRENYHHDNDEGYKKDSNDGWQKDINDGQ